MRSARVLASRTFLTLLALAVLLVCGACTSGVTRMAGSPANTRMAGLPANILLVRGDTLRTLLAGKQNLAQTFAGRTTYLVSPNWARPVVPRVAGHVVPTAWYKSFADFAGDLARGVVPRADRAVLFDIEKWGATPLVEQQNPREYMLRFSRLARAHGLIPILAPARDLVLVRGSDCQKRQGETLSPAYLRCGLPRAVAGAAILVVQSQIDQSSAPAYDRFVTAAARQARASNPSVKVLAQLATAPLGRAASLAQLVTAARTVTDNVQGFSLVARMSDTVIGQGLLWSFRQS